MPTIDIRVGGDSITDHCLFAQCRFISVADGNPGTATVAIDNTGGVFTPDDLRTGRELELYIDGVRQWDGWIMTLRRGWPFEVEDTSVPGGAPKWWTLGGIDRNLLFGKRFMYDVSDPESRLGFKIWPPGTPDKTAIEYALDHYVNLAGDDLVLNIHEIDSPSPWEDFTLGHVAAPMGTLFEDCSEMTGGVYWIGPARSLNYRSDRIVTAPFILSDDPTGAQVGYREMDAKLDYTDPATQALVWGAGKGSAEPVFAKFTNDTARQTYGLWQWGDEYIGSSDQQTVNRRARTYVNGSTTHRRGHDDPVPSVACTIFEPGVRAGHVVDFRSTLYDYQEDLPVRKVEMSFPTTTEVKFELDLSTRVDTPWGVPDPWWRKKRQRNPYKERILPEGPTVIEPAVSDLLIDHYDSDFTGHVLPRVWARHLRDTTARSQWTINLSTSVTGGIQAGDVIMVMWTHTPQPTQAGVWGAPPDHPFDGQSAPVRKNITAAPGTYYSFSVLTGYQIFEAVQYVYYLRVTEDMDFIGQSQPDITLHTESTGDTTRVAWVSVVLRGSVGDPAYRSAMPGVPAIYNDDGTGFGSGEPGDHVWVNRLDDDNVRDAEDMYIFAFGVIGGITASGTPLDTNQQFLGGAVKIGTGDPVTYSVSTSYAYHILSVAASTQHPAYGLAIGRRASGAPADFPAPYLLMDSTGWASSEQYTTSQWAFALPAPLPELVTPPPSVTGAPWEGGNIYHASYSEVLVAATVSDSSIKRVVPSSLPGFNLYDQEIVLVTNEVLVEEGWLIGQPPPDYGQPGPFSGFSTEYWSGGVVSDVADLLVKWRYNGVNAPPFFQCLLTRWVSPTPMVEEEVWVAAMYFQIAGTGVNAPALQHDVTPYWTGPETWPVIAGAPDFSFPYHIYTTAPAPIENNVWYLTRMYMEGPNGEYGYPYGPGVGTDLYDTGRNWAKIKTWRADEPEPMSGDSAPLTWYWEEPRVTPYVPGDEMPVVAHDGWSAQIPVSWIRNSDIAIVGPEAVNPYTEIGDNIMEFNMGTVTGSDVGYEVDAIWRYGGGTSGGTGSIVSDIPLYDNTSHTEAGIYVTRYPYEAGSLVVYYQGLKLRKNIDYIEVDPQEGTFRILGSRDISTSLTVEYRRRGSVPNYTGGAVYRPAPQTQYGWGTPLDGYNCTAAASAMALDRHSLGQYTAFTGSPRSTPPNHRGYQYDQSGGMGVEDAEVAWQNGWGETLHYVGQTTWGNFVSLINEGRGAILSGVYSKLPASKRFSSFTGGHAIYINEQFGNGNFWGCDPLYRYPVIYTAAELEYYATGLFSPNMITAAFTKVT